MIRKLLKQVKKHRAILLILGIALFLRVYQLDYFLQFSGDEARDQLRLHSMIHGGQLIVTGPETTIGNFKLGPFFYYILSIPFVLSGGSPVAAGVFMAILDSLTTLCIYAFAKRYSLKTALLAAFMYAVTFWLTKYGGWAWNPNLTPFFGMIALLLFIKTKETNKIDLSAIGTVVALLISLQLHAQMIWFALPIYSVLLISKKKHIAKMLMLTICTSLIIYAPWIYYEATNNFENMRSIVYWISQTRESPGLATQLSTGLRDSSRLVSKLVTTYESSVFGVILFLATAIGLVLGKIKQSSLLITIMALFIISFTVTAEKKYLHFILPIAPLIMMGIAACINQVLGKLRHYEGVAICILIMCIAGSNGFFYVMHRRGIIGASPLTEFNSSYGQKKEAFLEYAKNNQEAISLQVDEQFKNEFTYLAVIYDQKIIFNSACNIIEERKEQKRYQIEIGALGLEFCDE